MTNSNNSIDLDINDVEEAAARIAPYIIATPLLESRWLTDLVGKPVMVKWESLQLTGSFKLRGALNKLIQLKAGGIDRVLTVSAGNHGLGVAHAARLLDMHATIIVPTNAASTKVAAIRSYGVELRAHGDSYDQAEHYARELSNREQIEFVSPYNDIDIILGQATAALEMLRLHPFDLLIVPVGGGGLLAGSAIVARDYRERLRHAVNVIGAQSANSTAMHSSFRAGLLVNVAETATIADGLAGNIEADSITFPIIRQLVSEIVTVSETAIEQAIANYLEHDHMVVEGSGAVNAAALFQADFIANSSLIGLIASGRNIDLTRLYKIIASRIKS